MNRPANMKEVVLIKKDLEQQVLELSLRVSTLEQKAKRKPRKKKAS